ncbi:hypothetical protein [Arthrobacter caoxuetaonis]|uniref:hypothetical protein n=1 Tax=Arthrobacter caoxuetaonis TaxID=2886935 RepID=UPI001D15C27C|nr:hypothetical protein [Arthrobacter caoxuetaonis]MCC3283927.1 hypothetical protein [Arthrobacter caoxuetaonis]
MTPLRAAACLLAGSLLAGSQLLTGCTGTSGPGEQDPSPAGTASSGSQRGTVPASPDAGTPRSSTGTRTGPAAGPAAGTASQEPDFSPNRLEAAVASVNANLGLGGEVLTGESLRAAFPAGSQAAEGVTFAPAACAGIAGTDSVAAVQDASLAGLAYGTAGEAPTVLNVAAYADDSLLDRLEYIDESVLTGCAEVKMSKDGQQVTITNTQLDASTAAEQTLALNTTVSGAGSQTQLVVVSARTGSVRIVVSMPAPADPRAAVQEAAAVIDAVLENLGLIVR